MAVAAGPAEGLASLASWLAVTIDGLDEHARGVHGAPLARALASVLAAQRRAAASAASARGPNRLVGLNPLQQMRAARAAQDARMGRL